MQDDAREEGDNGNITPHTATLFDMNIFPALNYIYLQE